MNKKFFSLVKLSFFSLFILISNFYLFISCSQNLPDIRETECSVIFTFKDDISKPEARLSLFIENGSDVRRCERIKLQSKSTNYIWETNKVMKISAEDYQWAGNVSFVVPDGEKIPQGVYEIVYVNGDQEDDKTKCTLAYDEKLYDVLASDIPTIMFDKAENKLAIFSDENILLYFGEKTEELSTKGDIFNAYGNAKYFQDIWISYDKSVICILPENKL